MTVLNRIAAGLLLGAALALTPAAEAQNYPTKNSPRGGAVRGGRPDRRDRPPGRAEAQRSCYGHAFTIENIPGAGGNTGTAQVAKAPADGYTLLVISTGFMVNPSLYARVPYDPVKEFAPVTLIAASPNVLAGATRRCRPNRSRS